MAHLALYRKYRPQTFDDLIGQPHVARSLRNAVRDGRIAHAYLFAGPRGTGKTTTARLLAKALNCERGAAPEPCGECESCRRIAAGSALDVIEIDAASKTSVDDIRELRERVQTAPAVSRYKLYIVDEVHMLSTSAFNAFLKTLEEPPSYVIFVLCTTEPHKLPATVLSRCQRYDFRRLAAADLMALIEKVAERENLTLDERAADLLVRAAWGSARDALSLLEQAVSYAGSEVTAADIQDLVGGVDAELLADFADAIAERNVDQAFHLVAKAADEGCDLRQLAADLVGHFRDLLLLRVCKRGAELVVLPEGSAQRIKDQAAKFDERDITRAAHVFSETERELRRSEQQRLTLELAMVRLASEEVEATAPTQESRAAAAAPTRAKRSQQPARAQPEQAAQPSQGTTSPGEQTSPPAGEVSLEFVQQRWPALLDKLRAQRRSALAAFLAEGAPIELSGDRLVLGFNHEFHCDQMKSPQRQKMVAEAIAEETGRDFTLEFKLSPPQERSGTEGADDDENIKNIMSMFPGSEIV